MNNRNGYREDKPCCCYFHPTQVFVGVCPLCLNERLLIVAAQQVRRRHHHHHHSSSSASSKSKSSSHNNRLQSSDSVHCSKPNTSSIHKIFAFGNSLFTRPESTQQQWKSEINNHQYDISPSPEESFISIKFEENGVASWEKSKVSNDKAFLENRNTKSWNHNGMTQNKETKSVIEHGKSRDLLRWRNRIGHMFQLIRWKRTGGVCHVGTKVEGVKMRKGGGWMRTLTKRKKTVE